jgi:glycosyltransferase involved in cell wall biosynthesis
MGPQDGVEHALHALGQLAQRRRDWRAIFAGEGEMLPGLRRLAVDLGIADAVEFSGWLDDSALLRVLSSADICLAPEPSNPLNDASTMVKVAEYMALSRTVVATDLPETRATAGDTALYARAGDADEFARRIDEALGDHAGRRALGERARHRVETTLSWERSVQALLRAYRLALTRRGRSPHGARTIDPEPDAGS